VHEGVCNCESVEDEPPEDERGKRKRGADGERDAAGDESELELDGVDHGEQEEEGAHDGACGGEQHHGLRVAQHGAAALPGLGGAPRGHLLAVVGRQRGLGGVAVGVEDVGGEQRDGQLHALRHQAGEQVEAEGEDLEEEEVARDVVAGEAVGGDAGGGGDGARDADEDGHREEGVGGDDALQRLHGHVRVAATYRRHSGQVASWLYLYLVVFLL
jgi:hypothetical protein